MSKHWLWHALGDQSREGICLCTLGMAYYSLGENQRSIEHYEQALAIACKIGDRQGQGACIVNLGRAYKNLGDLSSAADLLETSLRIFAEIGSPEADVVRSDLDELRG